MAETDNETNESGVQQLVDRIRADGVRSGQEEAARLVREAEQEAAGILARAKTPEIKQALRDNTEAAEAAGACGVPSMQVHFPDGVGRKPLLCWGQDRLEMVDAALGGAPASVWGERDEA